MGNLLNSTNASSDSTIQNQNSNPIPIIKKKYSNYEVPVEYQTKFQAVLDELEKHTGQMFKMSLVVYGQDFKSFEDTSNCNCVLGDFRKRHLIVEVYGLLEPYSDLNGVYDSFDEMKKNFDEFYKRYINSGKYMKNFNISHITNEISIIEGSVGPYMDITKPIGNYRFLKESL